MPTTAKLIFTVAILCIGGLTFFVSSKPNSAGPNAFWRLGEKDPFRRLLFRPDGSFRRHTRSTALIVLAMAIVALWFLVPTA